MFCQRRYIIYLQEFEKIKYILVVCVALAVILCVQHESGFVQPASGNGTNDFETGPKTPGKKNDSQTLNGLQKLCFRAVLDYIAALFPVSAVGSSFDEIVAKTNLNIRVRPSVRYRDLAKISNAKAEFSTTTADPVRKTSL